MPPPSPSPLGLALVAAGVLAASPASASTVSVSEVVTLNTLLQGTSTSLSFDLNPLLARSGFRPDEVVGGLVSVYGFSDADYTATVTSPYAAYSPMVTGTHTGYYSYYVPGYRSCGFWSCRYYSGYTAYAAYTVYDYQVLRERTVDHIDSVADTLQLKVGASQASAAASQTYARSDAWTGYSADPGGSTCNRDSYGNCSYTTVYNREQHRYQAVYGALQTQLALDGNALADVNADGLLQVDLTATLGQMRVESISFELLLQPTPQGLLSVLGSSANANAIPEPASLPLAGLGLAAAAAAAASRRRRA